MTIFAFLAIYLFCSFAITFIFSCVFGFSDSLQDRRKQERRVTLRQDGFDRRVSHKVHAFSIS